MMIIIIEVVMLINI